jgi:hypothetical protein
MLHESNHFVMLYKTVRELLTANHDEVNNSETLSSTGTII